MMSEEVVARVTDENYTRLIQSPCCVVVFGIVPCTQCEQYDPILREAARQFGDAVRFGKAKMHVPGACREIKRKYRFESFPTTHFYQDGNLVHQIEGKVDLSALTQKIQQILLA